MILRPIEIGARQHLVSLENPGDPVPDGEGGFTTPWLGLTPPRAWALIEPATVARLERVWAGTVSSDATVLISFPYHSGVTTKTRITLGARTFFVVGVDDPYAQQVTTIAACTEVVA